MRRLSLLPIVISVIVLAAAALGVGHTPTARAAPVGAAQNVTPFSQSCLANGSVLTRFAWNPSGWGVQWFDISAVNNGFSSNFLNAGPLAPGHNQLDWYQLVENTRYYVRVNTFTNIGWLASDTITFVTPDCPGSNAAPARNLAVISQSCLENNSVLTRFSWQPSGSGEQWFDISAINNNFTAFWLNAGPLAANHNQLDWYQLVENTRYYVRVNTFTNIGWLPSDTITFVTPTCSNFSPPTNPSATVLGPTSVRFDWKRGNNNVLFCIDTAQSEDHLLHFGATFVNLGCGTTGETFTATNLPCGVKQWFRIWAIGTNGSFGYSPVGTYTTQSCNAFSVPTNLDADLISGGKVRFEWDRGTDNLWFCVETATSSSDLTATANSWQTWGCGTTNESLEVSIVASGSGGLLCNTTYHWRVFARGTDTNGVSAASTVATGPCA